MKSLENQIIFLDTILLPLFGFKNITDYTTIFNMTTFKKNNTALTKINDKIDEFKKVFAVKNFNMHKTEYKIKTHEQAFNMLKKCLEITSVQYRIKTVKNTKQLRLISTNNMLKMYIEKNYRMAEIRTNDKNPKEISGSEIASEWMVSALDTDNFNKIDNLLTYDELSKQIKKEYTRTFTVKPQYLVVKSGVMREITRLEIDLWNYELKDKNIKSIKLDIKSISDNGNELLSDNFINQHFSTATYNLMIGGASVYDSLYPADGELIPKNFILLNEHQNVHNSCMVISNTNHLLYPCLDFVITVTYVEFYKELNDKIKKCGVHQYIQKDNGLINLLTTAYNMAGLRFTEYITKDNFDKVIKHVNVGTQINNTDITIKKNIDIPGKKISIGKLHGFELKRDEINHNFLLPLCLDKPYDISVKSCLLKPDMKSFYSTNCNDKCINYLDISIQRDADIIDDIVMIFDKPITKEHLTANIVSSITDGKEQCITTLSLLKMDTTGLIFKNDTSLMYNIVGYPGCCKLSLKYESTNTLNPYENITLQYKELYLQPEARKIIASSKIQKINIAELEKAYEYKKN